VKVEDGDDWLPFSGVGGEECGAEGGADGADGTEGGMAARVRVATVSEAGRSPGALNPGDMRMPTGIADAALPGTLRSMRRCSLGVRNDTCSCLHG
jgi:hypothetical protein